MSINKYESRMLRYAIRTLIVFNETRNLLSVHPDKYSPMVFTQLFGYDKNLQSVVHVQSPGSIVLPDRTHSYIMSQLRVSVSCWAHDVTIPVGAVTFVCDVTCHRSSK